MYSGTVQREYGVVPSAFTLIQNCPNPFNPSKKNQYPVPANGRAVLKKFITLGQHVTTMFNSEAEVGTFHIVDFSVNGLAAGFYFARIEFGGHALLKKMAYVK